MVAKEIYAGLGMRGSKTRGTQSHKTDPLDLHLGETVLPNNDIGSGTVLTVVEEDNPEDFKLANNLAYTTNNWTNYLHGIGIHALASVELVILEVGDQLILDKVGSASLESLDLLGGLASLLELSLDSLHVTYSNTY